MRRIVCEDILTGRRQKCTKLGVSSIIKWTQEHCLHRYIKCSFTSLQLSEANSKIQDLAVENKHLNAELKASQDECAALCSALHLLEQSNPSHGDSNESEPPRINVVRSVTLVLLMCYGFELFRVVMLCCWASSPQHLKERSVFMFSACQSVQEGLLTQQYSIRFRKTCIFRTLLCKHHIVPFSLRSHLSNF